MSGSHGPVVLAACLVLTGPIVLAGCGGKAPAAARRLSHRRTPSVPLPFPAQPISDSSGSTGYLVPAPGPGRICLVTYNTGRFLRELCLRRFRLPRMTRKLRRAKGWVVATLKVTR